MGAHDSAAEGSTLTRRLSVLATLPSSPVVLHDHTYALPAALTAATCAHGPHTHEAYSQLQPHLGKCIFTATTQPRSVLSIGRRPPLCLLGCICAPMALVM
jgi:hypothetical protein